MGNYKVTNYSPHVGIGVDLVLTGWQVFDSRSSEVQEMREDEKNEISETSEANERNTAKCERTFFRNERAP